MVEIKLRKARQLVDREEWPLAWGLVNEVLNEAPERAEALFLLGLIVREQGHVGLALTVLRRAIAAAPKQIQIWMHYGATLHDLCMYDEAREAFMHVSNHMPTDPMPMANISAGYIQQGKALDSIAWADKALALDNENHIAHISKGFACLALGRWKDAWVHKNHLYGNQLQVRVYNPKEQEEPEWDGSKGKTVVVQCDQGVGDQLMFAQCINQMKDDCEKVIIECSERMVPVFQRNFPFADVCGTLKKMSGFDWPKKYKIDAHVSISFLGKFYRNSNEDFPREKYIIPDPILVEKWKTWLSRFPGPHIGLSWKGGVPHTQREMRSMRLDELAPVMDREGSFFDLSYSDNDREVALWNLKNKTQVIKPPIDDKNFDDTMAFASALNDIVTVTTTMAHVCGCIGKHAYVLVPRISQWRYAYHFGGGKEMIWYPTGSTTLYRQKPGEAGWDHAIGRVVKDMDKIKLLRAA